MVEGGVAAQKSWATSSCGAKDLGEVGFGVELLKIGGGIPTTISLSWNYTLSKTMYPN